MFCSPRRPAVGYSAATRTERNTWIETSMQNEHATPGWNESDISDNEDCRGWNAVMVDLRCSWCGREVGGARGVIHRVTARLLLNTTDDRYNVAGGRPRCQVCEGPLLLEDWRAANARTLLDLLAECLPGSSAA